MSSRRSSLVNLQKINNSTHVGLWADRYLAQQPMRKDPLTPYVEHLARCCEIGQSTAYQRSFNRWRTALKDLGTQPREAEVTYRLAAGHGRESVNETGLIMHHTYGVPIIPGSSLKGAAASYAKRRLQDWGKNDEAHRELFGAMDLVGYATFYDALPLPGTWRLLPDTITVHHRDYYRNQDAPPADWDSPTPIPFLSVTGKFLIAVGVPDTDPDALEWRDRAYEILGLALKEDGVGGKTSSGYGRLEYATRR